MRTPEPSPPVRPQFTLADAVPLLARTPRTLEALLRDLPAPWLAADEGPRTWTPVDIVAHLVHTERTNWIPRAAHILEHGTARPFDEFDRFGHAGERLPPLADLLETFTALRGESLRALSRVRPEDLAREGQHPALGVVTLQQLLAAWLTHDLDHVMQIVRVMARRYTADVGPWRAYLRIVRDVPA